MVTGGCSCVLLSAGTTFLYCLANRSDTECNIHLLQKEKKKSCQVCNYVELEDEAEHKSGLIKVVSIFCTITKKHNNLDICSTVYFAFLHR